MQGLFDAEEVIRAKYVGLPKTQGDKVALLLDLSSRQFEQLTERLYHSMGYDTWLTQPSRDGGRDIVAKIDDGARHEFLLVECKAVKFVGWVEQSKLSALNFDRQAKLNRISLIWLDTNIFYIYKSRLL